MFERSGAYAVISGNYFQSADQDSETRNPTGAVSLAGQLKTPFAFHTQANLSRNEVETKIDTRVGIISGLLSVAPGSAPEAKGKKEFSVDIQVIVIVKPYLASCIGRSMHGKYRRVFINVPSSIAQGRPAEVFSGCDFLYVQHMDIIRTGIASLKRGNNLVFGAFHFKGQVFSLPYAFFELIFKSYLQRRHVLP